jgi:hypothetical protein
MVKRCQAFPTRSWVDLHYVCGTSSCGEQLLSATHLVSLGLFDIPHSGYFSPEAMVILLSMLSSLKTLYLQFQSPQSHPDWESRRPPPLKCSVIPSLTLFCFKGVKVYLEDLVTCIDSPQLYFLEIVFFNQIDFDSQRLAQFLNRTPKFRTRDEAHMEFDDGRDVDVRLKCRTHKSGCATFQIKISCREPDWQLSSIVQVCNSSLPPLSMVEDLYIGYQFGRMMPTRTPCGWNSGCYFHLPQ